MREILYRLRVPLLVLALVAISAGILLRDRPALQTGGRTVGVGAAALFELAAPVQRLVAAPVVFVRGLWRRYLALLDVRSENELLRGQVARLEEENVQFREALLQSGQLEAIAALRQEIGIQMLPALVVGADASPWFRAVLLDRGRAHGVRPGMPAAAMGGVVGIVTTVSAHASKAMLLIDPQSAVDGIVQRSRVQGIVRGLGTQELEFEYDGPPEAVQPGDVVISSGLGGVYPKGLRIGEVMRAASGGPGHMLRQARLQPGVDFGRLEEVFVVLWRSPTLEFLYDDDRDQTTGEVPGTAAPAPGS